MPKTTANPRVDLNVSERSLWRNSRRDRGDLKASAGYGANRPPHELVAGPRKQHARPIRTITPPEARANSPDTVTILQALLAWLD
ncbi:hypothetical protein E4U52_006497 [Claviceps spartinae]|nr:hypothetical protein E4U52_006497 [Claviceps spartinae]